MLVLKNFDYLPDWTRINDVFISYDGTKWEFAEDDGTESTPIKLVPFGYDKKQNVWFQWCSRSGQSNISKFFNIVFQETPLKQKMFEF